LFAGVRLRPLRHAGLALLLSLGASSGPALAAPTAPAGPAPPDRPAVEREIADLETRTAHGEPLAEPLGRARKALSRAQAMERAGDLAHAALAVATAREWLNVARDVVRVVHAEAAAMLAERKQEEALTRLTRSRALLEESVARRGRAASVLAELEAKPGVPGASAPAPTPATGKPAPAGGKPAPVSGKPAPATGKPAPGTPPAPPQPGTSP